MSALIQRSNEWHKLRQTKIGASDAPIILGVSPWKTPYQLWQDKISGVIKPPTESMQRGIDLEDTARAYFCLITGIEMEPDVVISHKNEFMMASLDGIDVKKSHIVEIKCPGKKDHATALDGKIPDKYFPQLQHQLAVVDLDMAYYFSFDGTDGVVVEIQRNDEYIEKLIQAEKEFYQCMIDSIPPTLMERDFSYRDDDEWSFPATEWKSLSQEIKILQERQKNLRQDLIRIAGQTNVKGAGISLSKTIRKGSIDDSTIPEHICIELEKHRKPSQEIWRLSEI